MIHRGLALLSRHERIKILILALCFFCIISTYTVLREVRDVLFVNIVGREYVQYGQLIALFGLVPFLMMYAFCVDKLKMQTLVRSCMWVYAIGGFICSWCVISPTIGLGNTLISAHRIFGWVQYLFVEAYPPFVISVFLAYVNSVTRPESASVSYASIVAGSKVGGMATALFSWWFLRSALASDAELIHYLLLGAFCLLACVPLLLRLLLAVVPESQLHGYEASYVQQKLAEPEKPVARESILSGLKLMFKFPYAFGIFSLVFFWEVISVILNNQRLNLCLGLSPSVGGFTSLLFMHMVWINILGFFLALIGGTLISRLGQRQSLVLVPLLTVLAAICYFVVDVPTIMLGAYIFARAFNFSIALSVREALYIPTTKEIRFKCKSWSDTFGAKLGRGTGSFYGLMIQRLGMVGEMPYLVICLVASCVWAMVAYLLGNRFNRAIKNNEVIG